MSGNAAVTAVTISNAAAYHGDSKETACPSTP